MADKNETQILVTTGYGHRFRQPFVNLTVGSQDVHIQMSPAEARAVGRLLLEGAEAAESDAFLIEFMRGRVGVDETTVVGILEEFRGWREGRGGQA